MNFVEEICLFVFVCLVEKFGFNLESCAGALSVTGGLAPTYKVCHIQRLEVSLQTAVIELAPPIWCHFHIFTFPTLRGPRLEEFVRTLARSSSSPLWVELYE